MHKPEHSRLKALFAAQDINLRTPEALTTMGLTLNLRLESSKLMAWLKAYMDPYFAKPDLTAEQAAFDVDYVYADEIVHYASGLIETIGSEASIQRSASSRLEMLPLAEKTYLLVEPVEGIAYLVDWGAGHIQAAYSAKTRWPAKALDALVIEILTRYLEGIGFCNYHAGAFATERGVVVVCGKGGSGKTTLLSGAVMAGAQLIANERCFIRVDENGVYAMGFPQKVFVGLGMGLNFKGLRRYAFDPSTLSGPQRRYNRDRVAATPYKDMGRLGDKFGMLTGEFCRALNGSEPLVGGKVVGIVAPQITAKIAQSYLAPMAPAALEALMQRNSLSLGRDKHFAYWLDLGFSYADKHHVALGKIPGTVMHYGIKDQKFKGMEDPLGAIYDGLSG